MKQGKKQVKRVNSFLLKILLVLLFENLTSFFLSRRIVQGSSSMLCCRSTLKYHVWELSSVFLQIQSSMASAAPTSSASKKRYYEGVDNSSRSSIQKKKKTFSPNYFIGIRLSCPVLKALVVEMQRDISTQFPQFKKCLTSPNKLHLTCFVMELGSDVDIHTATSCFMSCQSYIQNTFAPSQSSSSLQCYGLFLNRISTFDTSVLYIAPSNTNNKLAPAPYCPTTSVPPISCDKTSPSPLDTKTPPPTASSSSSSSAALHATTLPHLVDITAHLSTQFAKAGLLPPPASGKTSSQGKAQAKTNWVPHCTIAKTSADRKHGRWGHAMTPYLYNLLSHLFIY